MSKTFLEILNGGGLRGKIAEAIVELMDEYFGYCSTARAATEEKAVCGISNTEKRVRLQEEVGEANENGERLEGTIVKLYDILME